MGDLPTHPQAPAELLGRIQALTETLQRERALFSGGPVVVFRWIATGGWPVEYVSPNVIDLFGFSDEDFLSGRVSYASVIHPDDLARVSAEVAHHSETGASNFEQDYRIRRADGSVRWLYDYTAVLRDETGAITHYDGYVLDISERRDAEAAVREKDAQLKNAQKMEALGRLAGGIAHDFNNIITAILGHADLVRMNLPDTSPAASSLDAVLRSAERAADLTRQLLAFSRKQVLEPRGTDMVALVADTMAMLKPLLDEHVSLLIDLGEPLPVKVDPSQLEQVLVNLVFNARDAMPGGGTLSVATDLYTLIAPCKAAMNDTVPPGSYARLSLRDTGSGMDRETLPRIFEPFFTTREAEGTGLGLSTVYGIVRQSNGYVRVESEPGAGSRFEVLLPLFQGALPAVRESSHRGPLQGTERLLLAEDHDDIRAATASALRARGYEVITARDGIEAVEHLCGQEHPIDLLITDVVMPRRGGVALAELLTAEGQAPAVLFLSGYTDRPIRELSVPHAILQKPFTIEALLTRVRALLDGGSLSATPR